MAGVAHALLQEHRHPYVRKNAVLAIHSINRFNENLIPDAATLIHAYLLQETEPSCKRNAFLMLVNTDQTLAIRYLLSVLEEVPQMTNGFQLLIVELIRKAARHNPTERVRAHSPWPLWIHAHVMPRRMATV